MSSLFAPQGSPPFLAEFAQTAERWVRDMLAAPFKLKSYTVANLPNAASYYSTSTKYGYAGLIFVSDETGGAVPAFSDGTNWRRVTDRTIVS